MTLILIESPYNGDKQRNLRYLAWCMYEVADGGDVPLASHYIGPLFWNEEAGREWGLAMREQMAMAVQREGGIVRYFSDLGNTKGMQWAYDLDKQKGRTVVATRLSGTNYKLFAAGKWPPNGQFRLAVNEEAT